MGYNNNYAGMHMMRYRQYAAYDDLEYYDKIAQEDYSRKNLLEKESKKNKSSVRNEINMDDVKPNKKKKGKDTSSKNFIPSCPSRKYGTEKVINLSHFMSADLVSKNIMIYALKNKKDAYQILLDAEELLKQDMRTNAKLSFSDGWSWMPMLEKTMIFLSIVAEKLECTIQELFINDVEYRKRFVYKLLDDIDDYEWDEGEVDEEGNATITIRGFDHSHHLTDRNYSIEIIDSMDLSVERQIYTDGVNYALAYGCLMVRVTSAYDFAVKGAYLFDEERGKLQELVDRLIENHPEWKE